jgi:orotidine-5'-phosphate decarboxylase
MKLTSARWDIRARVHLWEIRSASQGPAEAIANGADYLVIGRQVTRSSDPRGEFLKICDEIAAKAE